ncbi:DUF6471 domain-containing protein [Sphingomonas echinoides]|uniref:DUF6471 domain-containing protein n=1 Tax=Sphingomonas echinoides TaxID=59803 RepID=UPI003D695D98
MPPDARWYRQLNKRDIVDIEQNIGNKLARGKLTAVFLIQCLEAIGASSLRLSSD